LQKNEWKYILIYTEVLQFNVIYFDEGAPAAITGMGSFQSGVYFTIFSFTSSDGLIFPSTRAGTRYFSERIDGGL
jgi:hypothetical protein